jgi:hypothetical protein
MYSNPKTGTSTVEFNAKQSLGESKVMIVNKPNMDDFDALTDTQISALDFVSGHRLTQERVKRLQRIHEGTEVITLFRSPAEQIVSAYNYDTNYKYGRKIPFWFWYRFLIPKNPQASHFVRRFQGKWIASFFLSSRHFKQILEDFGLFNKVILTENINYEIPKLYENVGIELLNGELVRRKATGKDYIKYKSLDPKLRARLEKENKLDYQLYQYFKKQPTA